jgi:hypothetical protein
MSQIQERDRRLNRLLDGLGWGLLLILIGILFLADNFGWTHGEEWFYFAIGVGCILIVGFLVRYFGGHSNHWAAWGRLVSGLALVYIGMAFLYGFGDWWPLALIPVGIGFLVKAFWSSKNELSTH